MSLATHYPYKVGARASNLLVEVMYLGVEFHVIKRRSKLWTDRNCENHFREILYKGKDFFLITIETEQDTRAMC